MLKFWGIAKKTNIMVGCTGQTVYIYENNLEVAKFKDIKYGYNPMFCPNKNIVVVKSTSGMLAIYSLDELKLLRKFHFSKVNNSQDDGFCFSKDGKFFYNIERHIDSCKTRLAIYDTSNFEVVKYLFEEDYSMVLSHIEFDVEKNSLFILGFMRDDSGSFNYGFVSSFTNDELINITKISNEQYEYISGFKSLEIFGFTSKAKEWSNLKYKGYNLDNIEENHLYISDYLTKGLVI
ncbi:hypothetical protein FDF86_01180 [Clostridium botulinum]|nr:hypothetical protein [Clostridium botulinum]